MKAETVDAIFSRMTLAYGTRFRDQWQGMSANDVKALWLHELRGLSPEQVKHGLNNLPGKYPINAMEFKALCREYVAPTKVTERLAYVGAVKPSKQVSERLAGLGRGRGSPLAWALRLKAREEAGERLTEFQAVAWRRALPQSTSERGSPYENEAKSDETL